MNDNYAIIINTPNMLEHALSISTNKHMVVDAVLDYILEITYNDAVTNRIHKGLLLCELMPGYTFEQIHEAAIELQDILASELVLGKILKVVDITPNTMVLRVVNNEGDKQ